MRAFQVRGLRFRLPPHALGAAMPWIARYEGYANCKKDIARGYGNIPRSTTSVLGGFEPMEGTQYFMGH